MLVEVDDVIGNEGPQTGACELDFEADFNSGCQELGQNAIQNCHREMGTEPRTRSEDNSSLETPLFCWEASISFQIPLGENPGLYSLNPKCPIMQGMGVGKGDGKDSRSTSPVSLV